MAGQTLVHKKKRFLARLAITEDDGTFHWGKGADTAFIAKDGTKFTDKLSNFTHVEDEWDRPYCGDIKKGQYVDESAEKYIDPRNRLKIRRAAIKKLKETFAFLEQQLLQCMIERKKFESKYKHYNEPHWSYDKGRIRYYVGQNYLQNNYLDFSQWFLKRRNSKPLFYAKLWDDKYHAEAYSFEYGDKTWVWERMRSENGFIEQP